MPLRLCFLVEGRAGFVLHHEEVKFEGPEVGELGMDLGDVLAAYS